MNQLLALFSESHFYVHSQLKVMMLCWVMLLSAPAVQAGNFPKDSPDSLQQQLSKTLPDSIRIEVLRQLVEVYKYRQSDSARWWAQQLLDFAIDINYPYGIGEGYYKLGQVSIIQGHNEEALNYYKKGLEVFRQEQNEVKISDGRYYVATVYDRRGEHQKALALHLENLSQAEAKQDTFDLARTCWDVGESYRLQQDGPNAEAYFSRAKAYFDKLGNLRWAYKSEYHLALARDLQGNIAEATRILAGLFKYYPILDAYDSSNIYNDTGRGLIDIGLYDSAESVLKKALVLQQQFDLPARRAGTLNELATLYLRKKDYQKAVRYGLEALEYGQKSGNIYKMRDITDKLNRAYRGLGKYKEAYDYLRQHETFIDSLYQIEKVEAVANIQAQYETEKKEKENLLLKEETARASLALKRQQIITTATIIGLFLVSIVAFLAYRAYTIRRKAARKIQELNETQTRWFTNIAHELRTPLTLIKGPLENLCQQAGRLPVPVAEEISLANKNAHHLLRLVNQILDVSKMDLGELSLEQKPTDISSLTKQSAAFFASLASYKKIAMAVSVDQKIYAHIDSEKIKNVLINLIANALKFTHEGGEVAITASHNKTNGMLEVSVKDTGEGIPESDIPKIFDRFYQVQGDKVNQGGSGIGLALSLEYVKLHGGNIIAKSQPGKGSEFTLCLPDSLLCVPPTEEQNSEENLVAEKAKTLPPLTARSSDKPNILLVEDNPDMQEYIINNLKVNYHLVSANDGLAAIETLKNFTPDLIISDVMMPRMDGLTFARKLKESIKYKVIPFITLTARTDEEARLDALRIGIDDYIVKPFNPEELATRVMNLLTNYQERKQLIAEQQADGLDEDTYSHAEELIVRLKNKVQEHLTDSDFAVKDLAGFASMSESTLHRTVKKITGLTPGQFIREIKLQKALELLELRKYQTIAEVVYAVGFENQSHFTKLFRNRFGKNPREYFG